ncbi:MAG: hypothetical protein K9N23_05675 [Akkermansiaceae bacterium]|nr:hypothetical protein [Akkermansiaceae bacterium]MCF7731152.1 hypothetical protein [Akkermansiaceae bacterium]
MKTKLQSLLAVAALALIPAAHAADGHVHVKKVAGPNGGLVITAVEPHCELLVTPERKLKITFLGDDGKPAALKEQSLTGTGGDRSKPTKFTFTRVGESLVSAQVLPAGDSIPLILQIKTSPDAKPVSKRIALNLGHCPGCNLAEYACTCDAHQH